MMTKQHTIVLVAIIFMVACALLLLRFSDMRLGAQKILFDARPTAEAAYHLGNMHFDVEHPERYNLDRAKAYYEHAIALDPLYPLVRHQLARIEFLRSQFSEALRVIDEEIALSPEPATPSSYYVRGLIKGFAGDFAGAVPDYERYLETDPGNWAAANDLAWVLLKDDRPKEALAAIRRVAPIWPGNPWLLNSAAIALFEMGDYSEAFEVAKDAAHAVQTIDEGDWRRAYPGNDPLIAGEGVEALRESIVHNMHRIELALRGS